MLIAGVQVGGKAGDAAGAWLDGRRVQRRAAAGAATERARYDGEDWRRRRR